jgi:integrase
MSILSRSYRRRRLAAIQPSSGTQLREPTPPSKQDQDTPTFSEFLVEFRQDFGGWSPVTWRGLSGVLRNLEAEFGKVRLSEIAPRAIDRYLSRRRREDGITTATCNRYLAALKTLFKQARIWSYIEELPTDALQMQKEASTVPDALSDDELERLLQHCPEPTYTIVAFAADTGMRKSEIGRLCWGDLDLGIGIITVRKTKNGRFRAIPMTARVHELLSLTMPDDSTPDTSVFVRADIGPMLKKAALAAGIPHVHMHRLRHTFATRLRDRGVPLDRVMELLGHSSYQMVLRYVKARPQQLRGAIDALDARADSPTTENPS